MSCLPLFKFETTTSSFTMWSIDVVCIIMSLRKSKVWAHFIKINDKRAKCKLCNTEIASSGGTTNMSTHLRRHHGIHDVAATQSSPSLNLKTTGLKQEKTLGRYYISLDVKNIICINSTSCRKYFLFSWHGVTASSILEYRHVMTHECGPISGYNIIPDNYLFIAKDVLQMVISEHRCY